MKKTTDYIKKLAELKKFGIKEEHELTPDLTSDVTIGANKKIRNVRTLGDPSLIAKSQKIFGGEMAEQPGEVKGPTAGQTELGTSKASDLSGSWGKKG